MALKENCILNQTEINNKIRRIAFQIYECNIDEQEVVIAGIYSNGYLFAQKIKSVLLKISNINPLLCKVEINKNEVSYTIETLNKLQSNHPDWNIFLILGADAFQAIDTWKQCSQLLNFCNIVVGTRPGTELQVSNSIRNKLSLGTSETDVTVFKNLQKGTGVTFFQISPLEISSKDIRQRIHSEDEVKNLLPPSVDHYIMQHRLYREDFPSNSGLNERKI